MVTLARADVHAVPVLQVLTMILAQNALKMPAMRLKIKQFIDAIHMLCHGTVGRLL